MPHPTEDILPNLTCRGCGKPLSKKIRRRGVAKTYRRHLSSSPDCPLMGRGEAIDDSDDHKRALRKAGASPS
jgi:hypothetical protein